MDLEATKKLVDMHINRYCEKQKGSARQVSPRYVALWDSIELLLLAGGKRLRPHLLIISYVAYSQSNKIDAILPAAVAQELLHSAMLIHDDIIDRDSIRYGVSNISGQYDTSYAPFIDDRTERSHMSLSTALLAGDILLSDAHRMLRRVDKPQKLVDQATEIFSHAIFEVIGGELLDTEAAFLPVELITAETIAKFKTANYSFTSPLITGATLAGASESELYLLTQLSNHLGIGYQMRDDILGVFGNEDKTGKSASTDIIEGKRTFLIEQFEAIATVEQKEHFFKIFHRADATSAELQQARELLTLSGARKYVEQRIDSLRKTTHSLIDRLSINELAREELHTVTDQCLQREV